VGKFLCLVETNPVSGQEQEYNKWYDSQHLVDLLRIPGIVAAQRYRLADLREAQSCEYQYLAIYEIETEDIDEIPNAIAEARRQGHMRSSTALDREKYSMLYFEPITEKMASSGPVSSADGI
jgi:hypothetical protein